MVVWHDLVGYTRGWRATKVKKHAVDQLFESMRYEVSICSRPEFPLSLLAQEIKDGRNVVATVPLQE